MKNQKFTPFAILFILFLCFCGGLFLGRNFAPPPHRIAPSPAQEEFTQAEPVDLNRADLRTLMTLPGLGQVTAQRILDYRDANGPFTSATQLLNIDGIGQVRLEALLPYITTGGK